MQEINKKIEEKMKEYDVEWSKLFNKIGYPRAEKHIRLFLIGAMDEIATLSKKEEKERIREMIYQTPIETVGNSAATVQQILALLSPKT